VTAVLLLAGAAASAATANGRPAAWPPEHMKHLPADHLERLHATLSLGADRIAALDFATSRKEDSITWARYGIDALVLGRHVEKVNRFFASDKFAWGENPKFGFSLFATEYQRLYALFNDRTGLIKGRLSPKAQENLEREMWRIAKANSKLAEAKPGGLGHGGFGKPPHHEQERRSAGGAVPPQPSGPREAEIRRRLDAGRAIRGAAAALPDVV
jgi:hypothetical protein